MKFRSIAAIVFGVFFMFIANAQNAPPDCDVRRRDPQRPVNFDSGRPLRADIAQKVGNLSGSEDRFGDEMRKAWRVSAAFAGVMP